MKHILWRHSKTKLYLNHDNVVNIETFYDVTQNQALS